MASASGGTITGRVHAEGKTGADQDANCGKYDSPQLKFAEKVDYDSIRDFVVYIDQPVGTNAPVVPDKPVQVLTTKKQVSQKGDIQSARPADCRGHNGGMAEQGRHFSQCLLRLRSN